MKTIIFPLLFTFSLFAQDVITVGRGSGSYTYVVTTGTNQIVNGDLYLYGNFTKTQTDTGAYSFRPYIVWKYTGGSYDSSAALRIANSFLSRVNAPILDTAGTYYASMLYKTKNGNWIYTRGVDSSFTTPAQIVPPDTVPVQFTFTDITGADLNTTYTSNGVPIIGLDSAWAYAAGDSFKLHINDAWRVSGTKAYGGDTAYIKLKTGGLYSQKYNKTLTIGGVSDVYSVTTMANPFPGVYWYVDGDLTGTDNGGTSWGDAWESLAEINWGSVNGGDVIYISGGSTSKTYAEILDPADWQGTATSRLTIIAGKYSPSPSGHDGSVILNGIHFGGPELGSGNMPSYITVKGFTVTGSNVFLEGDFQWIKGIVIDSCYIHDYGSDFGVKVIKYVDSVIIQNNRIIDCLAGDCAGDRDGIHVNEDAGGIPKNIIIRNNWVRVTSQDPDAHNDAFQAVSGDGFYVYNNVFINDSVNSPQGGGMPSILSAVDGDNNDSPPVLVFNNFMFMNGIWQADANQGWVYELRHDAGTTWAESLPTYIFGNTMVSNGPRNRVFGNGEAYLNLALNNIWASFCLPDGATDWRTASAHGWMEVFGVGEVYGHVCIIDSVRANLFWRQDSTDGPQVGGQQSMIIGDFNTGSLDYSSDWADWISIGGSGLFRDPKLVTPFGHLSDQGSAVPDILSSSPAIDAGENYTYLVNYLHTTYPVIPQDVLDAILLDFYGNVRGADGDWDIGAVEYAP